MKGQADREQERKNREFVRERLKTEQNGREKKKKDRGDRDRGL